MKGIRVMKTRILFPAVIFGLMLLGMSLTGCDSKKSSHPSAQASAALVSHLKVDVKGPNGEQTLCPFTGQSINKQYFAEKNGKRIYVSAQPIILIVGNNFVPIAAAMEKAGIVLEKAGGGK
jgi:hypothetical protein